jgi:hypothetical protein
MTSSAPGRCRVGGTGADGDGGEEERLVILGRTLKAIGVVIAGFVGGGILWAAGHWVIGLILVCGALPVALTVWIVADD